MDLQQLWLQLADLRVWSPPKAPAARERARDPSKYDDPELLIASAAKKILAKEIAGNHTQYNDSDWHGALVQKENHANAIVKVSVKVRVPDQLSPNTAQKLIQILRLMGRMPKSGELVLIRMPFEDIMGSLSFNTESGTVSACKQVKRPNFHPFLISTGKYLESPGKESRVKLTGFIMRSFSHHSKPIQWIDGNARRRKLSYYKCPGNTLL